MSAFIDFDKMSRFEEHFVLETVKKCISVASEYNGDVYGEFVTDVIVPKMVDPNCKVSFKEVDLWFHLQAHGNSFVNAMGNSLKLIESISNERYRYMLIEAGVIISYINVVITPTHQVYDFDVNTVLFRVENNEYILNGYSYAKYLVDQIKIKTAALLPSYQDNGNIQRMKDKGWTILASPYTKSSKSDINKLDSSKIMNALEKLSNIINSDIYVCTRFSGNFHLTKIEKDNSLLEAIDLLTSHFKN